MWLLLSVLKRYFSLVGSIERIHTLHFLPMLLFIMKSSNKCHHVRYVINRMVIYL